VPIEWVWINEPRVSVLECAGPPALLQHKSGGAKRQGTAAVQGLAESQSGVQRHGYEFVYRVLMRKTFNAKAQRREVAMIFIVFGSDFGNHGLVNAISRPALVSLDFTVLRLCAFALNSDCMDSLKVSLVTRHSPGPAT
jgi:hypothetical protein